MRYHTTSFVSEIGLKLAIKNCKLAVSRNGFQIFKDIEWGDFDFQIIMGKILTPPFPEKITRNLRNLLEN